MYLRGVCVSYNCPVVIRLAREVQVNAAFVLDSYRATGRDTDDPVLWEKVKEER